MKSQTAPIESIDAQKMEVGYTPDLNMGYDSNYVRPWYEGITHTQFVMPTILFVLFLTLALNAYYLHMKQKTDPNIKGSIILTNALAALFAIGLAVLLYTTYHPVHGSLEWNQMMIST